MGKPSAETLLQVQLCLKAGSDLPYVIQFIRGRDASDDFVTSIAATVPREVAEAIVVNQARLILHEPLLEAIERNRNLSEDQRRRLRELRATFHLPFRS